MLVSDKKVVTLHYTLRDAAGEVLDTSRDGDPLTYLHGARQIVPGLEEALTGLSAGTSRDVVVPPERGYGPSDPEGVFRIPRSALPPGAAPEVGQALLGEDEEGNAVQVRVVGIDDGSITVDANHPLAGVELHFQVEIVGVRDATDEELSSGAPDAD
jgi:FKBP-type peptidyl-prolyl cis-trans isomerase SlyD